MMRRNVIEGIREAFLADWVVIRYGPNEVFRLAPERLERVTSARVGKNAWTLLKSMKKGEHSLCSVKDEEFRRNEDPQTLTTYLGQLANEEVRFPTWEIEIHLQQLYKLDDIFSDGSLVKKQIFRGKSTAKPDKVSSIEFDLWIYTASSQGDGEFRVPDASQLVYQSTDLLPPFDQSASNQPRILEDNQEENGEQVANKTRLRYYIDDPGVSKLLRQCLLRSKKQELALYFASKCQEIVTCGFDHQVLKQKFSGVIPEHLVYAILVHTFTEVDSAYLVDTGFQGKNNFTMTLDEKIEHAGRKKQMALDLIRTQNFRKALKVFKTVNAYFDYGSFTPEEKLKMRPHQVSALLNTTLCQLKQKEWKDLCTAADKILALEPNAKAVLRKAQALKELCEYDQAIELVHKYERQQSLICEQQSEPFDEEVKREIAKVAREVVKLKSNYKSQQKQLYSKMFQS